VFYSVKAIHALWDGQTAVCSY